MKCEFCNKEHKSKPSLRQHRVRCHQNPNRIILHCTTPKGSDAAKKIAETLKIKAIEKYSTNPKYCKNCSSVLRYELRNNVYCSEQCYKESKSKIPHTAETKLKISAALRARAEKQIKSQRSQLDFAMDEAKVLNIPFTRIYTCKCQHCTRTSFLRARQKYCNHCSPMYAENGRAKFVFSFNVYHFPELFDIGFINQYGWRSKANPNGVTRDHKVSVNEAIRNNYDPYYIRHPLNCELMLFEQNNKKKTKSSIIYQELVQLVTEYESKRRL